MENPRVFMDLECDRKNLGRIIFKLRKDVVPKTVENFRSLCTGETGIGYQGTEIHKVIANFICQGGHIKPEEGIGGRCIYGEKFADENFVLRHDRAGILSMANNGPCTNGSQFFITLSACSQLDGKHVVFGMVEKGLTILRQLEQEANADGKPSQKIVISNCGQLD